MLLVRPPQCLPPNTALCLGAFDGMHRGHVALLETAAEKAEHIAVATFDPHPAVVLAPDRAPSMLQTLGQTQRICAELGVDAFAILAFSKELAATPAEKFVEDYVIRAFEPAHVVVGEDFFYGAGRQGTPAALQRQLAAGGIGCSIVALIDDQGQPCPTADPRSASKNKISSTLLRQWVAEGRMQQVHQGLGRAYALEGTVVHGEARGRNLGFRTANLKYQGLAPKPGVYSAYLRVVGWPNSANPSRVTEVWPAVCNVGSNPTFTATTASEQSRPMVETHVLDRDLGESLYGATVEVVFVDRLRDEQRFAGIPELKAAIARDADTARRTLTKGADAVQNLRPRPVPRPKRQGAHG